MYIACLSIVGVAARCWILRGTSLSILTVLCLIIIMKINTLWIKSLLLCLHLRLSLCLWLCLRLRLGLGLGLLHLRGQLLLLLLAEVALVEDLALGCQALTVISGARGCTCSLQAVPHLLGIHGRLNHLYSLALACTTPSIRQPTHPVALHARVHNEATLGFIELAVLWGAIILTTLDN